jgi:hypothetical protein
LVRCDDSLFLGLNIEYLNFMEGSQDFLKREFFRLMSDTLALLGADRRLIEDIKDVDKISPKVIDKIRKYNRDQESKAKARAALLNTTFSYS